MSFTPIDDQDIDGEFQDDLNENLRQIGFLKRVAKSAAFTQWAGDTVGNLEHYYACTGTFPVTLVAANSLDAVAGRSTVVKNIGAGVITVTAAGADTIEGAASIPVAANDSVTIISDGVSNWEVY